MIQNDQEFPVQKRLLQVCKVYLIKMNLMIDRFVSGAGAKSDEESK